MCAAPNIQQPQRLQASQEPVFSRSQAEGRGTRGRAGTIMSGASTQMPANTAKKTLLGQ